MALLLGRSDDLERLVSLAETHERIVIVGVPGVGRRTFAEHFLKANDGWSMREDADAPHTLRVATEVPSENVGVLRLAPLAAGPSLELLVNGLASLGVDTPDEFMLHALLVHADGLPRAIKTLARVVAAEGARGALKRLEHTPLLQVLAHDEGTSAWRDALLDMTRALPESASNALYLLGRLHKPFGHEIRCLLGDDFGAELILAERGMLVDCGHSRRQVLRCFAGLERTKEQRSQLSERFAAWALERARETGGREDVEAELWTLFRQEAPRDARHARRAGALLAPLVADIGPIRPHLDRLIALDSLVHDTDTETECAIAQLRLVIGEPETMWRRLEPVLDDAGAHQGRAHHLAGSCQRRLGDNVAARAHYALAIASFERADPQHELGMVLSNLGGLEVECGDASAARRAWSRALRHFVAEANPRAEGIVLGDLGLLDHESGDYESAQRRYERAQELHVAGGNVRFAGIVSCDLGELALLRGSPKEAAAHLEQALTHLRRTEDSRQVTLAEAALALAEAACGDLEGATRRLNEVRDHAPENLWPVMALYDAAIAVHKAGATRRAGDVEAEAKHLARAQAALAREVSSPDEARRVAQLLRAELRRYEERVGWAIAHDAGFFVTPDDARVDLSRRRISQRLLGALLDHRLAHPGETLGLEDLLRAGWPGQRVLQTAARNRLHVALSGLRKLGIDPLLRRRGDGYLLDPDIELSVVH
ncbi:MAG: tetratricopeptide repeat protein [Polyangiales bacterium]